MRPWQQEREQLGPALAVDDPVDQVWPEPPLKRDHRLLGVGDIIAEPLQRQQEAGIGPVRVDEVAGGAREREATLREKVL